MTWLVESFDVQTDELLTDFDLDVLAARAVERLIGPRPAVLTPEQIGMVAPLFDIEPDHWESTTGPAADFAAYDPDWVSTALAHLAGKLVDRSPESLVGSVHLMSREVAQELLDRFSAGVRVPDGETSIGFFAS